MKPVRNWIKTVSLIVMILAGSVAVGHAQDKVYLFSPGVPATVSTPARDAFIRQVVVTPGGTLTTARHDRLPIHRTLGTPQPLNGGQMLVWASTTYADPKTAYIAAYDTRTGAANVLPGLTFAAADTAAGRFPMLVTDPSRLLLFVIDGELRIHRVDATGSTQLVTLSPFPQGVYSIRAAVRDTRLFVWGTAPPFNLGVLHIIDARTGVFERTVTSLNESVDQISSDARRVYLRSWSTTLRLLRLRVMDADTWTETVRREWTGISSETFLLTTDETRGFLALTAEDRSVLGLLDANSLQDLGTVNTGIPLANRRLDRFAHAGGQAPLFYQSRLIEVGYLDSCAVTQPRLEVVNGRTGQFQAQMPLGDECPAIVPVSPPLPPKALSSTLAGQDVTLAWTAPLDASGFELEVGSAPGLRNLVVLRLGREPTLTVPGVPPGTYFVRVRGVNEQGTGLASNEVTVVVP